MAGEPVTPKGTLVSQEEEQKSGLHILALRCIGSILSAMVAQIETPNSHSIVGSPITADVDDMPEGRSRGTSESGGVPLSRKQQAIESYQQKQKQKRDLETAAAKFATKPRRGLEFLVEHGYIGNTPEEFADALLQFKDTFDKTQIGEFLGEDKEFNIETLYKYVDKFQFMGTSIDLALREFLAGFRLPGEAQKIDRMMEKFAARYYEDNTALFPSADTPYVLAFAIIMLNTDLHNPNIPADRKMTKDGFIRQNRGIAGGRDLDPEYLYLIFDRIKETPISLKEDDGERAKLKTNNNRGMGLFSNAKEATTRRKRVAFSQERHHMVTSVTSILSNKAKSKPTSLSLISNRTTENVDPSNMQIETELDYDELQSIDHVEPMFAVTWAPFLAVFSRNMQISNDFSVVNTAISSMKCAIKLAGLFHMQDQQLTLLSGLIQFTLLNSNQEMKAKNIACVQALVEVVQTEADFLAESSWQQALMCFSQLGRLQSQSSTVSTAKRNIQSENLFSYFQNSKSPEQQARATDEENAVRIVKTFDMVQVDRIFMDSVNLNSTAIVNLVSALCAVSRAELHKPKPGEAVFSAYSGLNTGPRIFSLQKIVEVSDFNMNVRPRFIWSQVWSILSSHFTLAGCHENDTISMYAVDSLRQLSVKFLKKEELAGFSFQSQFMQPFGNMMAGAHTNVLRDLVLRCLQNIVLSRGMSLKSGWKVVLQAVTQAAGEAKNLELNFLALEILNYILKEHFVSAKEGYFNDVVECVVGFLCNSSIPATKAVGSVKLLHNLFSDVLANDSSDQIVMHLWPILTGFSTLIADPRHEIRHEATNSLFDTVENYACRFSGSMWKHLFFGILLPLFEKVTQKLQPCSLDIYKRLREKRDVLESMKAEMGIEPCGVSIPLQVILDQSSVREIIFKFIDLLIGFYNDDYIGNNVVEDNWDSSQWKSDIQANLLVPVAPHVFMLLEWFSLSEMDFAAKVGVASLSRFVIGAGEYFDTQMWSLYCGTINSILMDATPRALCEDVTRDWMDATQEYDNALPNEDGLEFVFYHPKPTSSLPFQVTSVHNLCSIQTQVLQLMGNSYPKNLKLIDQTDILSSLEAIYNTVKFSRQFNDDLGLRIELFKRGYSHGHSKAGYPTLLSQETLALTRYINLLFRLYAEFEVGLLDLTSETTTEMERMLEEVMHTVLMHYLFQDRMISAGTDDGDIMEKEDLEYDFASYTPVVLLSLRQVLDWDVNNIKRHLQWLYPLLTALLDCGNREVHTLLRQIFDQQISKLLGLDLKK